MLLNKHKKNRKNNCLNQLFCHQRIVMNISKLYLAYSLFSLYFTQSSEIIVRPATLNDIHAIKHFTNQMFWNHFAPLYSYIIPADDFNNFMCRHIEKQHNACLEFINKQHNQEPYGVCVAEKTTPYEQPELVGYCRFNQKNPQNVHIYFVGVDTSLRRQGIGAKLIQAAIHSFENLTHCTLRTHAYRNDETHAFYQKLGFKIVGFASLDPQTGIISDNSDLPITHANYYLTIQ